MSSPTVPAGHARPRPVPPAPPAPAAPVRAYPPASVGQRLLAYLIDIAAVAAAACGAWLLTGSLLVGAIVAAEVTIGLTVWEGHAGATLGQLALGLRTVRAGTPETAGVARTLPRALVFGAAHLLVLGPILLIVTAAGGGARRQAWHDRIGDLQVIDARKAERQPAPAPALPYAAGVRAAFPPAAPPRPRLPEVVPPGATHAQRPPAPAAPAGAAWRPAPVPTEPEDTGIPLHTQLPPSAITRAEAPERPAPPANRPDAPANGGRTSADGAPPAPRTRAEARAPQAAGPVPAAAPVPAFRLDDGTVVPVTGGGYIGRNPSAPEDQPDALLVTVPDPDRSLSRTHARFGVTRGGLWFEDLGSGNGSALSLPDGRTGQLTPHQRIAVSAGTRLHLGARVVEVIEQ